ncbi:hypothetical protein [Yinghuangia soli]|uniref:Secreted protein n=1 Tax=Yinghuangia soli TaxID=2908204 RepID=A0AA41Q6V8_9ACTN|nr:hypothetical protein [Yinghuangia soli]MCF2532653.1 hypothetical protein [Yinghuangia soli]
MRMRKLVASLAVAGGTVAALGMAAPSASATVYSCATPSATSIDPNTTGNACLIVGNSNELIGSSWLSFKSATPSAWSFCGWYQIIVKVNPNGSEETVSEMPAAGCLTAAQTSGSVGGYTPQAASVPGGSYRVKLGIWATYGSASTLEIVSVSPTLTVS